MSNRELTAVEHRDKILACHNCKRRQDCNAPVPFRRPREQATVLVLGSTPTAKDDELGIPFSGSAGKLLWKNLEISKAEVARAYAVCCKSDHSPVGAEMYACRANLYNQVKLINPKCILALGMAANRSLGNRTETMSRMHGKWYDLLWLETLHQDGYDVVQVFPTWSPIQAANNERINELWRQDLKTFAWEAA